MTVKAVSMRFSISWFTFKIETWQIKKQMPIGSRPGAKVCRGGCEIAIFAVYRDKSRYLTLAATDRDNLLFPRYFAIFVIFRVRLRFHSL